MRARCICDFLKFKVLANDITLEGVYIMNFNTVESKILEILNTFGALRPVQVKSLIQMESSEKEIDDAFKKLRSLNIISNISGGYYIGLSSGEKANKSMVESLWVLLCFITEVTSFKRGEYPAQVAFRKNGREYSIIRVKRGYEFLVSDFVKNRPNERIVFIVDDVSDISRVEQFLGDIVCVFAKLDYTNDVVPRIMFLAREGCDGG